MLTQPPMGDASSMGPLLQWTQPPSTTWFQVQVIPFNEDGPGINLVIGDSALVRAAQYQVLGPNFGSADPNYVLLPDMTYLWRVRTSTVLTNPTEADWSAWAVSSFKTPPASSSTITRVAPPYFGEVSTLTPTLDLGELQHRRVLLRGAGQQGLSSSGRTPSSTVSTCTAEPARRPTATWYPKPSP